jgi:hypothetical protein
VNIHITMADNNTINCDKLDSVVNGVLKQFVERANFGQLKYGTNLDRTDLSTLDWIQHAQEELMDGILYLEKLKQQHTIQKHDEV